MSNRKLCTGSAALACLSLFGAATAAPTFKILYHERLDITPRVDTDGRPHLSFDAYGRRFEVDLQTNDNIARGVPANRPDIKPYRGTLTGQAGSWVRLTQTRDGWRGVVSDGHEVYAIEPSKDLKDTAVQPLPLPAEGSASTPVIYRLADAIMPDGAAYCGTDLTESLTSSSGRNTALQALTHISADLAGVNDASMVATRELVVDAVADHTFTDNIGSDPQGAIVARWDIVDGIWSSQVGINIVLSPITVLTRTTDQFSATLVPTDLLAEVAAYRAGLSAHQVTGLTHLMTGRKLNGNIVGISYLGAICDGDSSVSLSLSTVSTTEAGLIAAHELGHSFNAVHDGAPGVCEGTAQSYLMAPVINFSNQFSACSLNSIRLRARTAACLVQVTGTGSAGAGAGGSGAAGSDGSGGGSGSGSSGDNGSNAGSGAGSTGGADVGSTGGTSSGSGGGGGSLDSLVLAVLSSLLATRRVVQHRSRT